MSERVGSLLVRPVVCIKEIIHLGSVGLDVKKIYLTYNLQQVHDNTVFFYISRCWISDFVFHL